MTTVAHLLAVALLAAQPARPLLPIDSARSWDARAARKPVHARRALDDSAGLAAWRLTGTGRLGTARDPGRGDVLRVEMQLFTGPPAPTRNRLSAVTLQRPLAGEDWRAYNRLALWIRVQSAGFPVVPFQIVLHNDGAEQVPDRYGREGIHYVSIAGNDSGWHRVLWEIDPLARDRVTMLEVGY